MSGWLKLAFEVVDFCVKGAISYAQTPAGQAELDDITAAWEARANNEDQGAVEFSVDRLNVEPDGSAQAGGIKFSPKKNG